jgi:hypothetical protein
MFLITQILNLRVIHRLQSLTRIPIKLRYFFLKHDLFGIDIFLALVKKAIIYVYK